MKIVCLAATTALLLASTAAQAGSNGNSVSFEIEGQKSTSRCRSVVIP